MVNLKFVALRYHMTIWYISTARQDRSNRKFNLYIICDDWNTEFHTLWFTGVLASTVALTPILCMSVQTSSLGGCCVPFSLPGPSSYLWVKAKVWFFRWFQQSYESLISQKISMWQKIGTKKCLKMFITPKPKVLELLRKLAYQDNSIDTLKTCMWVSGWLPFSVD